ncbi:hypothetical protein F4813DRAFT_359425 [Daldinia decipiens]|uniref:uncharacterized protein n=1 Tax=Daldinia decipiens TaxID=326647 RepID=UPI0020C2A19E|nr:uncharacterized protein F4813DRAFT_359425 [Daldinia decipiens]KAI1657749.1 hypothetical protein F4813DRAFT_359425 [Daldinia decipiens]
MSMSAITDTSAFERNRGWYQTDLIEVNEPFHQLLERYSKIPSSDIIDHVKKIRDRAFESSPYPCIGLFRFTNLTLITHPLYDKIVGILKSESTDAAYLDIGCCFGQDLRRLVFDGVPSERLVGLDIERPLLELGYDLFLDRETLKSHFVIADILEAQGKTWESLEERGFDVIHCSAVFHLFTLDRQVIAAKHIARLVKKGGIIIGRQMGSVKPGDVPALTKGTFSYRHDVDTFDAMWKKVGEATQTRWNVEGVMDMVNINPNNYLEGEDSRRLLFTVTRIE